MKQDTGGPTALILQIGKYLVQDAGHYGCTCCGQKY